MRPPKVPAGRIGIAITVAWGIPVVLRLFPRAHARAVRLFSNCLRCSANGRAGAIAAVLLAAPVQAAATERTSAPKWSPWIEFGGYYSSESSRGEAAAFAPLLQTNSSLFFFDLRTKLFEQAVNEGNFALGYRQMVGSWNLGVWAGYDRRRTGFGSVFNQVSAGFEALSANWDLRANVYLPLNHEKLISQSTTIIPTTTSVAIIGSDILMTTSGSQTISRLTEVAPRGFDAEVGYRLPILPDSLKQELRVYAGGFYFDHKLLAKEIAGPRARAEWRFNDIIPNLPGSRLSLEAEVRNDAVRGTDWEVGARLRIPFGNDRAYAQLNAQERRMTEAVRRDTDIVTSSRATKTSTTTSTSEKVEDALTGTDFDRVATVDGGGGNIQTAVTNAGGNSLIIASGTFNMGATMVNLAANQTVLGAGGTIQVRGLTSGKVANFTAAGAAPTYNFTGTVVTEAAFALAANTHVSGLNLVGDPGMSQDNNAFKFAASNTRNVHLTNLDLHNFYGGFVRNLTIDGTNVNNVELNMNRVVAHNDSRSSSAQSVALYGDNNIVNITNSSFSNIRLGLDFEGDGNTIKFDNVSIARTNLNVGAIGVRNATAGGTSTLTVTNSFFDDLRGAAIQTGTGIVNVTFANSTINGTPSTPFGLRIETDNSAWSVNNVTFSGRINTGISFSGTNNVLSGTGNVSTAIHGNTLCDTNGNVQIGSFGFTSPAVTCP